MADKKEFEIDLQNTFLGNPMPKDVLGVKLPAWISGYYSLQYDDGVSSAAPAYLKKSEQEDEMDADYAPNSRSVEPETPFELIRERRWKQTLACLMLFASFVCVSDIFVEHSASAIAGTLSGKFTFGALLVASQKIPVVGQVAALLVISFAAVYGMRYAADSVRTRNHALYDQDKLNATHKLLVDLSSRGQDQDIQKFVNLVKKYNSLRESRSLGLFQSASSNVLSAVLKHGQLSQQLEAIKKYFKTDSNQGKASFVAIVKAAEEYNRLARQDNLLRTEQIDEFGGSSSTSSQIRGSQEPGQSEVTVQANHFERNGSLNAATSNQTGLEGDSVDTFESLGDRDQYPVPATRFSF